MPDRAAALRILGLDASAGDAEIKVARNQLWKQYMPGANANDPAALAAMQRINSAWDLLKR